MTTEHLLVHRVLFAGDERGGKGCSVSAESSGGVFTDCKQHHGRLCDLRGAPIATTSGKVTDAISELQGCPRLYDDRFDVERFEQVSIRQKCVQSKQKMTHCVNTCDIVVVATAQTAEIEIFRKSGFSWFLWRATTCGARFLHTTSRF